MTKDKGFTLVEILVALAITSILSLALLSFFMVSQKNYQKEQSKDAEMQSLRLLGRMMESKLCQSSQYLGLDEVESCYLIYDESILDNPNNLYSAYCLEEDVLRVDAEGTRLENQITYLDGGYVIDGIQFCMNDIGILSILKTSLTRPWI